MPKVPTEILRLARSHHEQLIRLEKDARVSVTKTLERSLGRIERDQEFRKYSDFERLQAAEVEILSRLTAETTTQDLETALEEILDRGLSMAPTHAAAELQKWIEYYGAEARPLNLAAMSKIARESLIERIPNSLARWGPDVARRVRNELAASQATKTFSGDTITAIKGVIGAERWKADRIFRTELFNGYNAAHLDGLETARDVYQIDTKKSAIVTFDGRTDADSYPVHGQVRELNEKFTDGDGRRYLHPPGRPNDREKEIPWIDDGADFDLMPTEEGIEKARAERQRNSDLAQARKPVTKKVKPSADPVLPADTFEGRRERIILSWANGSNSNSSIALKEAVRQEFGLDGQLWNPYGRDLPKDLTRTRQDARRIYEDTQKHYSGRRAGSLRLYRGVKSDVVIEGAIESWTDDISVARKFAGKNGEVIFDDVDTRKIFASVDAPGWRNGRFGDQREFLVMSDPPALEFDIGDWQSGPVRASDIDENALEAGPWGVLRDSSGRGRLEHTPSGKTLLEGPEYGRDDLIEIARYLDRSGAYDARGLTAVGESNLEAMLDAVRVNYAGAVPSNVDGATAIELLGERLGEVNKSLKPAPPGVWSRRTIEVLRGDVNGYSAESVRGIIQGNFGIITDKRGAGDGTFTIVHLKTGKPIFEGTRTYYSAGYRVPVDVGGFKQDHMKRIAEKLEPYFDDSGAVIASKKDEFEKVISTLRNDDPSTAIALSIKHESEIEDWFKSALKVPDVDDVEDDPFMDFLVSPKLNASPNYAKRAVESMSDKKAKPSPSVDFDEAVKARRNALRRGQYNRYDDPDFDDAVQAEAKRLDDIDTEKRLASRVESLGFSVGDGRGFVEDARKHTELLNRK